MNASGYWPEDGHSRPNYGSSRTDIATHNSSFNAIASSLHHELQTQDAISQEELIDSIASASASDLQGGHYGRFEQDSGDDEDLHDERINETGSGMDASNAMTDQPTFEQIQQAYYKKGLEDLESLQLIDLSQLAHWKLSTYKQGYGINQLRDDSPESFWQSDGSNGNNNMNSATTNTMNNNQLSNPHSVTIQFSKRVSLERISIFTNFSLDESYTPSMIKIMAGSSGWDLNEVCTVNFNKPIGWSHIIFNGIRDDGVLKCFVVKLVVLANHQDGKDSHIRAIRCFGKKASSASKSAFPHKPDIANDILKNNSVLSQSSGLLFQANLSRLVEEHEIIFENPKKVDEGTSRVLGNVADVIGFNSGFQSIDLKSISSIR